MTFESFEDWYDETPMPRNEKAKASAALHNLNKKISHMAWTAARESMRKEFEIKMSEDHLMPLESATRDEWRKCAVHHEKQSFENGKKVLLLRSENTELKKQLSEARDVIASLWDAPARIQIQCDQGLIDASKRARTYLEKYPKGEDSE